MCILVYSFQSMLSCLLIYTTTATTALAAVAAAVVAQQQQQQQQLTTTVVMKVIPAVRVEYYTRSASGLARLLDAVSICLHRLVLHHDMHSSASTLSHCSAAVSQSYVAMYTPACTLIHVVLQLAHR
jgi:phage tail tape-measure protein